MKARRIYYSCGFDEDGEVNLYVDRDVVKLICEEYEARISEEIAMEDYIKAKRLIDEYLKLKELLENEPDSEVRDETEAD